MTLTRLKSRLAQRDGEGCFYCKKPAPVDELTIDHYIPKMRGGKNDDENRRLACYDCNQKKGNRPPKNFIMSLTK